MLTSKRDTLNCDHQAKFIHERILLTERNFSQIYQIFSEYIRKTARVRDKSDEISKIFLTFSENEDINKTLSQAMGNFALSFATLGDLGDLRIHKIDTIVLSELAQYENICKNAKEEVKHIFTVRDREIAKKRQLDKIRERNPRNRQQISQAETELLRATAEVSRTIHGLEEQTNDFEKRKLHDVKQILLNFITVEMAYHAKCLEVLTKSYQDIKEIDEESDLQDFQDKRGNFDVEFRQTLKSPDKFQNYKSKLNLFKASQSLGSLNTLFSSPKRQLFSVKKAAKPTNTTKSSETIDSIHTDVTSSDDSVEEIDSGSSSESDDTIDQFQAKKQSVKSIVKQ